MALTPAIFLDKDGTVLQDVPYNVDPEKMVFAPGAKEGLLRLSRLSVPLIVITNQPGLALGKFGYDGLHRMRRRLYGMFADAGAALTGFYFCPHLPAAASHHEGQRCDCRKPRPGLLLQAVHDHGIDLGRSWLVGDILDDVEAGHRAGCRAVLIDNGNETEWQVNGWRTPDQTVTDFLAASTFLIRQFHCAEKVRP